MATGRVGQGTRLPADAAALTSFLYGGAATRPPAPQLPWGDGHDLQSLSFGSTSMGSRGSGGQDSGDEWDDGADGKEATLEANLAYLREKER